MYALVFNNEVSQIEETPFPVHPAFSWIEFDSEIIDVQVGWFYIDGVFIPPEPPPPPPPLPVPTEFKALKPVIFTTSGTYTPTEGMAYCLVRAVGGGAGAGNAAGGTLGGAAGAGGGSGGWGIQIYTKEQIGESQTITIGAGGAATQAGGQTKFGNLLIANGGLPGASSNNILLALATSLGGAGAAAGTGGYLNLPGTPGGNSTINGVVIAGISGYGGSSYFGGGGLARNTAGAGQSGQAYGAGGSGAFATLVSQTGGSGVAGCVEIVEFLTIK